MPTMVVKNLSDKTIPMGTPIYLFAPEPGKPQMGHALLRDGKKVLVEVELEERTCEKYGHDDPDNSGMCIYCSAVLDEE
jgi:hypothetical protein